MWEMTDFVQELKKRLFSIGKKYTDENHIWKVLEFFGPSDDLNFVIQVIMMTRHLVSNESSKEKTDTYDSNTDSKESSHQSAGDAFDNFLQKKFLEDITELNNLRPGCSKDFDVHESDNFPKKKLQEVIITDTSDSNTDSEESSHHSNEDVFDNSLQKKSQEETTELNNLRPGCSKDFDVHESDNFPKKFQEEATLKEIPRKSSFKYKSVHAQTLRDKEMSTYALPPNTANALISKYMEYLNFRKCSKENKLKRQFPKSNFKVENRGREALLQPQIADCSVNNSNSNKHNTNTNSLFHDASSDAPRSHVRNRFKNKSTNLTTGLNNLQSISQSTSINTVSEKQRKPITCYLALPQKFSKRYCDSVVTVSSKSTTPTDYSVLDANNAFKGVRRKQCVKRKPVELPLKFKLIYEELISIFPQKKEEYIKNICYDYSEKENAGGPSTDLHDLFDFILQDTDLCSNKKDTIAKKETYIDDEQYTYLSGIFPDADSTYLKKVIQRMNGKEDALLQFIQTQCEQPTYPTKEEKLRRLKITNQQKQYVFKFDVKQFLEIFPDPFKHFEDPNRQCKYSNDAYNFLKSHFKQFKENTVMMLYVSQNHHLSLTAKLLENRLPDRTSDRDIKFFERYYLSEDIPLLQECAFIIHKVKIRERMNELREKEQLEFTKLKILNELLECECCFDNECMPFKCSTCDDGHIFCNPCIIKGVELKIAQGDTRISCFANCTGQFSLPTLQRILSPTQFSILISKKQEAEVLAAGLEGLVSCPFCHFASIPPPEDKIFKCLNPECMKESCRSCKKINHIPLKCHDEKVNKARLFVEEKMTEALVRKCYRCARPYFKVDGCNKITCPCGAIMCYICDKAVEGYGHFYDGTRHLQGTCPLMCNNDQINNDIVEAVGKKALEYVTKDKDIKLNQSQFLQYNSSTTVGRSVHAAALEERLNKITTFDA